MAETEAKEGFHKILSTCEVARTCGEEYVWIDTVCIDKRSSAELSEAINSMFSWYQSATTCFVFLEDFSYKSYKKLEFHNPGEEHSHNNALSRYRWFTRGWTLQELLAPKRVYFYDRHWTRMGTKRSLASQLSKARGIDAQTLRNRHSSWRYEASAAKKMSWASRHQTTRVEDMAYCLMGLFDINMPLLYGEGTQAFRRLQEEIIKVSTDQSLFAWDWPSSTSLSTHQVTMLAPSPSAFGKCHDVQSEYRPILSSQRRVKEFSITNMGLNICLHLIPTGEGGLFYGVLSCRHSQLGDILICIPLHRLHWSTTEILYRNTYLETISVPRRYILGEPRRFSVPRVYEPQFPLPPNVHRQTQEEQAVFVLFPVNDPANIIMKTWDIKGSGDEQLLGWNFKGGRKLDGHEILGRGAALINRRNNNTWLLAILWTKNFQWRHVWTELYDGDLEVGDGNKILERALRSAPSPGEAVVVCDDLILEVGFGLAAPKDGGRYVPLLLKASRNQGLK